MNKYDPRPGGHEGRKENIMIKDLRPGRAHHIVIGIDHGYGNIKTANTCFRAGVTAYDKEPYFKNDMVTYGGKYYVIGAEHKEFTADL